MSVQVKSALALSKSAISFSAFSISFYTGNPVLILTFLHLGKPQEIHFRHRICPVESENFEFYIIIS